MVLTRYKPSWQHMRDRPRRLRTLKPATALTVQTPYAACMGICSCISWGYSYHFMRAPVLA